MNKALILLSGGLDSATLLALASQQGRSCYALTLSYGQRHDAELHAAAKLAKHYQVIAHKQLELPLHAFGGSALTDSHLAVPIKETSGIPLTYVPARNLIFLAMATAWAEVLECRHLFIGVNAVDYSGYPDCRPAFIDAFSHMANLATKAADEGQALHIHTPLIDMSKADIIRQGTALGVDYAQTITCYQADAQGRACGLCDACRLRRQGFKEAGIADPTRYQTAAPRG